MNRVKLENSEEFLVNVHEDSKCLGDYCTIHHRSNHIMRNFPQHWREDRHIMERICTHGVGHPDPDEITRDATHGCDGCCIDMNEYLYRKHGNGSTGIYVNSGWFKLLFDLNKELEALIPDYRIFQVKEKFGGLRFYTAYAYSDEFEAIIEKYEELSLKTCEYCGRPGTINDTRSWIKTLCSMCNDY